VVVLAALLGSAATAAAIRHQAGDQVIEAEGGFTPKKLPKTHDAPVTLHGGGTLSTVSGALPPVLQTLTIEYDRHGSVVTTGLPVCRARQIESTTVWAARRNCGDAIVGEGRGKAMIVFPEQRPFPVESPITLFNGPRRHGDPTVLAHAYTIVPVPTTFVIPIVIERIHKGVYGYRTSARIPRIAAGAGIPVSGFLRIGRRWRYRGKRYSYINARCEDGRLQARGQFRFDDGTFLQGSLVKRCLARD
jgi:hypothetical protein